MKILSVAIPSYNSQDYMSNCIESLLPVGEDVEILIVDDGSKDDTGLIADRYQEQYPGIVRAIHQENGGHGEAVNTGLAHATGCFFKVVDSDDWVDEEAYRQIIDFLKETLDQDEPLDMLISNYVYEKKGALHKKVIHYHSILPENTFFGWEEIGHFGPSQNILMHSVIYRRQLLIDCGFRLPRHTFYVDNLFVYQPLPYVKRMYYLDVDFYRYFIGREDQSVNEKVMMSRIDQQIRVNKLMIDIFARHEEELAGTKLEEYMLHYLSTITLVTSVLLIKMKTDEAEIQRADVWKYLEEHSPKAFQVLKHSTLGHLSSSRNKLSEKITRGGYKIAQKWFGFN